MLGDSLEKQFNSYKTVWGYTLGRIRSNSLFSTSYRIYRYARGYLIISRIIRYAAAIITVIETSATMIVIFGALLIVIPLSLAAYGIMHLCGTLAHARRRDRPEYYIREGDKVMFILAGKPYSSKRSVYLRFMAKDFADRGYHVFVVSRYVFRDGMRSVCKKGRRLYVVKLYYFYSMKKRLIAKDVTYIS